MNEQLKIRQAAAADAAAMANIHSRSWSAAYAGLLPHDAIEKKNATRPALWQRLLNTPSADGTEYYLAELDGQPAGLMSLGHWRGEPDPERGEIHSVYLHPEYFGCGIGSALVQFGLKRLKELGFRKVSLWVLASNTRAITCYSRNGFQADGEREDFIGEPVKELRLSQDLSC